jgi:glutaminase
MQCTRTMSIVAGTLANGGRCPTTNERIFSPETVQSVLSVMFTCGMYDFSGQFSFSMGFPAKSGVAGACLIVVPNVMGICTWSPRLDMNGNSARGISFAQGLAEIYQIHNFDKVTGKMELPKEKTTTSITSTTTTVNAIRRSISEKFGFRDKNNGMKINPLFRPGAEVRELSQRLITASSTGDIIEVTCITEKYGIALVNIGDYDGRTPLHLACSEQRYSVLAYFLSRKGLVLNPVDRWGATPMDNATKNGDSKAIRLLTRAGSGAGE